MFKVTFSFEDGSVVEAFANAGDNLLEVARGANVAIDAPCSGNGACGKCRVQLKSGELESKKTLHISDEEYQEGWRLACCSKISADVDVLVPDIASAYKSRMKVADLSSKEEIAIFENAKRDVELAGIELKNSLEVVDVTMDPPSLDDTMPDNERLTRALRKYLNISRVRIPYAVLKKLPGWKTDIRGIKNYEDLPENCRKYIEFIEEQIGFPITMVSNGPGRHDIIYRNVK